jgi:hypothetical protein
MLWWMQHLTVGTGGIQWMTEVEWRYLLDVGLRRFGDRVRVFAMERRPLQRQIVDLAVSYE